MQSKTIGEYVPWLGHEREDIVLLKDGSIFSMFEVLGAPFETLTDQLIVDRKNRLNHTYCQMARDTITVSVWQHRGPAGEDVYPHIPTDTSFAKALNLGYRAHLLNRSLYENRSFVSLQFRPPTYRKIRRGIQDFLPWCHKQAVSDADQLDLHDDIMGLLANEFRDYQVRRLGERLRNRSRFSEIAETVVWMLSGQHRPIGQPAGLLSEAMFSEHIDIGWDSIKFIAPGGTRFAAIMGIQTYPEDTHPFMLSALLASSYQHTIRHTFRFVPTTGALETISRKNFWHTKANDPAKKQISALGDLADDISSGRLVLGDHSCSVLVFADSEPGLEKVASAAWSDLAGSGAKIVRETLGLKAAYLSMIPGNERLAPRKGYINSRNLASLAPMQCYPLGPERGHWGAPICLFRSRAGTPVRFHWHQDDVGNTLITGETGSGKTTLAAFLIAMTSGRARIIALDHKRGWQLLFRVLGGSYAVLGTGQPMFNPLKALTASGTDLAHLFDLYRGCIMADRGAELTPDQDRRLALALRMVMSLCPADRSLGEVRAFLGVDPNGPGARLEKWCLGKELGWTLDAPEDALTLSRLTGLDTTALLDNARARGPALLHLFYRINRELDGSPTLIPLDEGWRVLRDEVFGLKVEAQIRTIRSKNGSFVFLTQGAGEIRDASFRNVLVEQCPTQIHLPNPRATREDYVTGLKRTDGEFEVLRDLKKGSRMFLLCQGAESIAAELPLDGMDDFVAVLSGRETTLRLFDDAMSEAGGDVEQALPIFHALRSKETTL